MARLLLILGALLLLTTAPAQAADFNVSNTNDAGPGSLRQAIDDSNAATTDDTVNVPAGTYNLTSGELVIAGASTGALDVQGAGGGQTVIRATGGFRVVRIATNLDPVSFIGVTLAGGNVTGNGGGILNQAGSGALTIDHSVIRDNRSTTSGPGPAGGGGVYNDGGLLTVQDSAVTGNTATATGAGGSNGGGGILETGTTGLTLDRSLVAGNTATVSGSNSGGGGVRAGPGVTMSDSTLDGNRVNVSGLAPSSGGGGYFTSSGGSTLTNLTVTGNTTSLPGGGLFNLAGTAVALRNSIIAFNSAASPASTNCSGSFSSSGNNLESANTCNLTDPQDQKGADPKLGPLAGNGGPTQSRALLLGSPAIDAADGMFCGPFDQRGVDRPVGNACDIGAYEFDGLGSAAIPDCSPTGQIGVTMTAAPGEGVDGLNYKVDSGPQQFIDTPGGSQNSATIVFPEGRAKLEYWGEFTNGEEKGRHSANVLVDKTRPNVNVQSEQGRSIYVITRRASVSTRASDNLSGLVANPSGTGQRINTRSRGLQQVTRVARDLCGNQTTDSFDYRVLGPKLGTRAVIEPLSGRVGVAGRSGGSARTAQKGQRFSPVRQPREISMGSRIDTRRGRVRITSSRSGAATAIQDGQFAAGVFQVLQSRKRRSLGLTELRLSGSSFRSCAAARGKPASAALSRRLIRLLRASARGRFRTRGRHSAATVRGTIWSTADRCDGTLTSVSRGRVVVRDFRLRRNILLRAGKRYLARPFG